MSIELQANDFRYTPTADDELWLLRAVQVEGAPRDGVAAALVNAFMFWRTQGKGRKTLAEWVRAYAQPVNPLWFETGEKFKAWLPTQPAHERAALRQRARAREFVNARRTTFDAETHAAVRKALTVGTAYPDVTDYREWKTPRNPPWEKRTPIAPGTNTLYAHPLAVGFPGYSVLREPGDKGGHSVRVALLVSAAALALWLARSAPKGWPQ